MIAPGLAGRIHRWLKGRLQRATGRLRALRAEPQAWLADRASRSRHQALDERQLRALVRSRTCFIFGSGKSLDEITGPEWEAISQHNTIGFNYFMSARFVRVDFHLVGEGSSADAPTFSSLRLAVDEYAKLIEDNPFYRETVLGLQEGLRALHSNRLAASRLLRPGRRVFRYRRLARGRLRGPGRSLAEGLVHGAGTLVGCVNLAVILGFEEIVLAGVDLYDSRYFSHGDDRSDSHPAGPTESRAADGPHLTGDAMVEYLGDWAPRLAAQGINLCVYNPRSLLSRVLPVKERIA